MNDPPVPSADGHPRQEAFRIPQNLVSKSPVLFRGQGVVDTMTDLGAGSDRADQGEHDHAVGGATTVDDDDLTRLMKIAVAAPDPVRSPAFKELCLRVWPLVSRWIRCQMTGNESEDVFQNVMKRVIGSLTTYDSSKGPFLPYLRKIVDREVVRTLKDQRKRPEPSPDDMLELHCRGERFDPPDGLDPLTVAVITSLKQLHPQWLEIWKLRSWGFSSEMIGTELGMTAAAVNDRIFDSRDFVVREMTDRRLVLVAGSAARRADEAGFMRRCRFGTGVVFDFSPDDGQFVLGPKVTATGAVEVCDGFKVKLWLYLPGVYEVLHPRRGRPAPRGFVFRWKRWFVMPLQHPTSGSTHNRGRAGDDPGDLNISGDEDK